MKIGAYSYKGGVGRSVSTANIAVLLAKRGKKVGIIDADIEAPGIDQIFGIDVPSINLLDLLAYPDRYSISKNSFPVVDIKNELKLELDGELFILPSARDRKKLKSVTVDPSLSVIFDNIVKEFTEKYNLDYLFVDCRSGLAHYSVMTLWAVEVVLLFFGWGKQNFNGSNYILSNVIERIPKPSFSIASRIPDFIGEEELKERVQNTLGNKLLGYIMQDKDLAWEEQIIVLKNPESKAAKALTEISYKIEELGKI
ncbi:MAG: hypothetical protein DRP84_08230 [Spirochaetes bacterium]|nr:MAG: hypothetical protein DRP84_08230 [Spirochaetota bacterium]